MRNTMLALGVVLAGMATRFAGVSPSVPTASPHAGSVVVAKQKVAETGKKPPKLPDDHPIATLYQYFHPAGSAGDEPKTSSVSLEFRANGETKALFKGDVRDLSSDPSPKPEDITTDIVPLASKVECMIVTVNDPVRTHLAEDFDRIVESLSYAASDQGYSYDRNWLPWRQTEEEALSDDGRELSRKKARERMKLPGLMIFRQDGDSGERKTLLIFLVGETPTQGINPDQFHNALVFIKGLTCKAHPDALRILGPSFSGSYGSLVQALDPRDKTPNGAWLSLYKQIQLHSATATSYGAIAAARDRLQAPYPEPCPPPARGVQASASGHISPNPPPCSSPAPSASAEKVQKSRPSLCFQTLQSPDWDRVTFAVRQLRAERWATISEGDTMYGASIREREEEGAQNSATTGELAGGSKGENSPTAELHYPRDISFLRDAYQESDTGIAEERARALSSSSRLLPFSLRGQTGNDDAMPQFDSTHLPLVQESLLLRMVQRLRRERIELAVLTGTNVFDVLFLSRYLRRACPDVRLLLADWSLMMVHGADTLDFSGIAVASSFPPFPTYLDPERQLLLEAAAKLPVTPHPDPERQLLSKAMARIFASQSGPAVYLAARQLLGGEPQRVPDMWLSVIGREGFLPVAHHNYEGKPPLQPMRHTRAAYILHGLIQLGLLALACWYLLRLLRQLWTETEGTEGRIKGFFLGTERTDELAIPRWCADLHPSPNCPDGEAQTSFRALYFTLALTFFLTAQILFACGPAGYTLLEALHPNPAKIGMTLAVAFGVVLPALCTLLLLVSTWCYGGRIRGPQSWSSLVGTIIVSLLIPGSAVALLLPGGEIRSLSLYRWADLADGVSAPVPVALLCLAMGIWFWRCGLHVVIREDRCHRFPFLDSSFNPVTASIRRHFQEGSLSVEVRLTALLVIVLSGLICRRASDSFDALPFEWMFSLLAAIATGMLAVSLIRFWTGWKELRRLLTALEVHPIRHALSALPKVPLWHLLWQSSVNQRNYTLQKRSIESVELLLSAAPDYSSDPAYPSHVNALRHSANRVEASVLQDLRESSADVSNFNHAAGEVAKLLSRVLDTAWRQGHSAVINEEKKSRAGEPMHSVADSLKRLARLAPLEQPPDSAEITLPMELDRPSHQLASEFLALRIAAYIRYILLLLRNQFSMVTTTFMLTTFALFSYQFRGESFLRGLTLASFVASAAVSLVVFIQMETDSTLSRLTNTREGRLEPVFYLRILSFGALPMLAVLASVFPSLRTFLFSWVQPALAAMH